MSKTQGTLAIWRGKRVGQYGLSQKNGEYVQGGTKNLLTTDAVQSRVNQYLNYPANKKALAALYGKSEEELEAFLEVSDSLQARAKFQRAFEQKLKTIPHKYPVKGIMPSIKMEEFLGKDLLKLYKYAVQEEVSSKNYKNAVFLKSMSFYDGKTLEAPVYIAAGGPSGAGKSFLKKPSVKEAVQYLAKKRDAQGEAIREGNYVVSIDNGIARETLQTGKMLLEYAFSKGYKEIEDYNNVTKAQAKIQIKAAAQVVGLNMYKPKTYPKFHAYKTVLEMANTHDGYHQGHVRYDVVATNITANKEVVRHQGMTRSQLQEPFSEEEIDLNHPKMPAESKRYGQLVLDMDQKVGCLKNTSFHTGQNKSHNAAEEFRKSGIPVIEVDSTNRILVTFDPQSKAHQLTQVDNKIAGSSHVFITTQEAFEEWNCKSRLEGGKEKFREFEEDFLQNTPLTPRIKMDKPTQEIHAIQEAYVELYKKTHKRRLNVNLLPIEQFNEFLRLAGISSDNSLDQDTRKKLLCFLMSDTIGLVIKCNVFDRKFFDFEHLLNHDSESELKNNKKRIGFKFRQYISSITNSPIVRLNDHFHRVDIDSFSLKDPGSNSEAQLLIEAAQKPLKAFDYGKVLEELKEDIDVDWIQAIQARLLYAKSRLVVIEGKKIRVFNGAENFQIKTEDFYQKGLGYAHAMLKISQLEELSICQGKIQNYLTMYTQRMQTLQSDNATKDNFVLAKNHTLDFVGKLSYALSQARSLNNHDKAFEDIKKAAELYSMIDPTEDSICTVTQVGEGLNSCYEFQLSERLILEEPTENLTSIQPSLWYRNLLSKYGLWFNSFMHIHFKEVLMRSPLGMNQDMPNFPNAWRESSFVVDQNGNKKHAKQSHIRTGIVATDIHDQHEQARLAAESMKKLFNEKERERIVQDYLDRWGWLLPEEDTIFIEGLHQTLINPLWFGADQNRIKVKKESNEVVKGTLNASPLMAGQRKITIRLNQVNNSVRTGIVDVSSPHAMDESNNLIDGTAKLFQELLKFSEDDLVRAHWINFDTLISFLRATPYTPWTRLEKKILSETLEMLNSTQTTSLLSMERKRELSLMLQAAVHLKRLNHLIQKSKVVSPKNQVMKSVYELILANMAISGCKRALDDTSEVNNHKQAMMRQFNKTGYLFNTLSKQNEYEEYTILYYDAVVKTGHQNRVIAAVDKIGAAKNRGLKIASPNTKKAKVAIELRKVKNPLQKAKPEKIRKTLSKAYPQTPIARKTPPIIFIEQQSPRPIRLSVARPSKMPESPLMKKTVRPAAPLRKPPSRPK